MLDLIFSNCSNQNINWYTVLNTTIGTCTGALLAFGLNTIYTNKAKKEKQISEIVLFLYDLNILLKYLMFLYTDIENMLQDFSKGFKSKRAILFHNPIQLDEQPLHFIINKNPGLYESIIHTENDTNVIWSTMAEYNDACRIDINNRELLLFKMWYQIIRIVPKIHTNMLSLNIYYKKFYKNKTLINGYLVNIIKEATEFLVDFIKDKEDILYSDKTKLNKLTGKDYTNEEKANLEFIYSDCIAELYDEWIGTFGKGDKESFSYISGLADMIITINKKREDNDNTK